jgi:hypothetical protein
MPDARTGVRSGMVRTVLGPTAVDAMGATLMHEHIALEPQSSLSDLAKASSSPHCASGCSRSPAASSKWPAASAWPSLPLVPRPSFSLAYPARSCRAGLEPRGPRPSSRCGRRCGTRRSMRIGAGPSAAHAAAASAQGTRPSAAEDRPAAFAAAGNPLPRPRPFIKAVDPHANPISCLVEVGVSPPFPRVAPRKLLCYATPALRVGRLARSNLRGGIIANSRG